MAYGYPYQQPPSGGMPNYFNTNYQPPTPTPAPAQASNVTWIYVNGWDGARGQIVQPGQTAWMMDNNDPVIYIKAVDGLGSATLRGFRLEEITQQGLGGATPGDARYATATDLTAATERISRLESVLGGLLKSKDVGGDKNEPTGSDPR